MVEAKAEESVARSGFFAGHPRGLGVLFFTELWERFSFYGMRALLIFYLTKHFLFSDREAYAIYGAYTALVYIGPLVGGFIADRYLGARRAVALGAVLLALGHFTMALEGAPAVVLEDPALGHLVVRDGAMLQVLYLALALIIGGEAFLKPNISTLVGRLYAPNDRRRDAGFTLFYLGINVGAFAATLACGYLGETYGWRYGFGLAGVGMLIGLVVFLRGMRDLSAVGEAPEPAFLRRPIFGPLSGAGALYATSVPLVAAAFGLIQFPHIVGGSLALLCAAAGGGLATYAIVRCAPEARDRLLVALVLMMFAVVFFALFEQAGSSLNLFTDRSVDRHVLGFEIKASQIQSTNPLLIILLAPLFVWLWTNLGARGREPSTPQKFALGLIQIGLGFATLVLGAHLAGDDGRVALVWLLLSYLLQTTGELSLSPIGLSMVTKLSPTAIVGLAMGIWFLATAAAQFLAAAFASNASLEVAPDGTFNAATALARYADLFGTLALIALAAGFVLFALAPMLRRRMHGAD